MEAKEPISEVMLCDCMEYMRTVPDMFFDLTVADPPYGDPNHSFDLSGGQIRRAIRPILCSEVASDTENRAKWNRFSGGTWAERYRKPTMPTEDASRGTVRGGVEIPKWDVAPPQEYFDELFRISRHVIIWGGNYFSLPPTRCFLIWRKTNISEHFSMAMCEYAWTNFNGNAKVFSCPSLRNEHSGKFHPTEKRLELYAWIFDNYTNPGDKVFDPNMGSQSSRIAAYHRGIHYYGCEIDPYYYEKGCERFERECRGVRREGGTTYIQKQLFV